MDHVIDFAQLSINDVDTVGGKNASLGEMIRHLSNSDINVPNGFATTSQAFRRFIEQADLSEKIYSALDALDVEDVSALAKTGKAIRSWIMAAELPPELETAIREKFQQYGTSDSDAFAVRSSATAEDLPNASFAGQQETFLNVTGIEQILAKTKEVFASLFNDRAIAYRVHQQFSHRDVAISVGIQRMVRSDLSASGVMFTLDTESGFEDVVLITGAYGLGEMVVQGAVNPDEFYVYKPALKQNKPAILRRNLGSKALKMVYQSSDTTTSVATEEVPLEAQRTFCVTDEDIEQLAHMAIKIEAHYQRPMDIEWAKDGLDGKLYIVQARPETVKSQRQAIERYRLKEQGNRIVSGRSIGDRIGTGVAKVVSAIDDMSRINPGDVLVTDMTDPDWEPIMSRSAAIVTNRGGRTCHAAIIARELGIPAVVGCIDATKKITDGETVTVSCAEGDEGNVYQGSLAYDVQRHTVESLPELPVKIMLNVGNPDRAFTFRQVPNAGVGLARLEFIINHMIGIHPQALLNMDDLPAQLKQQIADKIAAYPDPRSYYIERLREGIATIAAAFYPKPVIFRLSDFKSNEYANLLGGSLYEPTEENPMIGFRGAARYVSKDFEPCFAMECEAIKRARNDMGLSNIEIMIPFVRTVGTAEQVINLLEAHGLKRGDNGLRIIMMCELPTNAILAKDYLAHFDGFSIGSNDLTQTTLGLDRDSELVADQFDERDPAVKALLSQAISQCKAMNKYIGICGQGPSDYPDFAEWLLDQGIESLSLNPDTALETWLYLAQNSKADAPA